jgi:hypothetical protein
MLNRFAEQRHTLSAHPGMVLDEHNGVPVPLPDSRTKVEYQVEQWLDVLTEMRELFDDHWREVALDHDAIKLEPDYLTYEMMARIGMLHLVTARDSGRIVGYHLSLIHPHLHYKSSLTAFTDVFYLRPDYRTGMTGYKLLKFFVTSVQERKVQKIYMMTKLHRDIGPILERMGFKPIERVYSMVFK